MNRSSEDMSVSLDFIDTLLKSCDMSVYFTTGDRELDYKSAGHKDVFEQIEAGCYLIFGWLVWW